MAQDPWAEFVNPTTPRQTAQPQPAQQAPAQSGPMMRTIAQAPDPRADRAEQRDQIRTDIAVGSDERARDEARFGRISTLRKEFITEPVVREFRQVRNATQQIMDLAARDSDKPGPGDIALIFSYMKALDPGSVVREGEFATAQNAGGVPETVMNAYNLLLEGGRLSPELKKEFAATAASIYNARLNTYNTFAQDYRGLVEAEGANPDEQGVRLAEPIEFAFPEEEVPDDGILRGRVTDTSAYDARVSAAADALEAQLGEAGLMELAKQGITLGLSDEGGAIGTTIGQALTGDFNFGENYDFNVDVERELLRRARERTGRYGVAAELVGGGGAVRTAGNMALNAGRAVAASGNPVTRGAIQSQMARQAGIDGAVVGGTAGFGYGEGTEESLAGGAVGAAGGYLLGRGGQAVSNRAANRRGGSGGSGGGGGGNPTPGQDVIRAADNFNAATGANVQPLPADTGGTLTRRLSGGVAQSTFGAKPIVEGAQAMNAEAQAGIRTLAGRQGNVPQSKQAGGEVAIRGADKTMKRTKLKVDALYTKARRAAGNAEVELPMARTVLQGHIDELSRTPGGTEGLSTLRELARDIGNRRFPVDSIKVMRSNLRDKFLKEGLRGSDLERRVNEVIDAAELDIEDGLIALGKQDAAKAYAEASKAASERFTLIDDVLAPVLGPKGDRSGEKVFQAIDRLSRGDAVSLGKFMRALPEEEAGSIRGIIIDRLGRASKGRQDADGQAFSLNDFLTRWNDEGLSKEAKAALFDGETRAALDDLARVAQGTKEGQRFANFSNTGGANWVNTILNGAPVGVALLEPFTAAAVGGSSVAMQASLGRLLASPRFARWLAKLPKQPNAAAAQNHIKGLEKIAAADAAIASDALGLQQQLLAAFRQGARPVAAEGQNAGSNTTGSGTQ